MEMIENRTFEEIAVGDRASADHLLTAQDIALFAAMSGDVNPAHMDAEYANSTMFEGIIGHGMWGASLISAVLGTELPGPGAIYLSQTLKFKKPVRLGDRVTAEVAVREKREGRRVVFDCECRNQEGEVVIAGEAVVLAPKDKVRRPAVAKPEAFVHENAARLKALIEKAKDRAPVRAGVVHPVNALTLNGVAGAMAENLIAPVLIGPKAKIEAAAEEAGFNLGPCEIIDVPHSHAAADAAVELARAGKIDVLMKGALHTDEIMGAVVASKTGLRTERRISHVYVMDTPAYEKLIFMTDAAINIAPDLEDKRDIVQNAVDLALALGVERPKAAILSAVETVYPKLQSTIDAAALCKMADRGQITGGVLDGPLAFDNAISPAAAAAKGIVSPVAGHADILLVPDIEAGNMLAKQLDYLAGAVAAGIALGARVPVILTSRAEGTLARTAASAVAKLYHYARHDALKPPKAS